MVEKLIIRKKRIKVEIFYNPHKLLTFVREPTCVIYFHEFAIWMVGVIVCKLLDMKQAFIIYFG